MLLVELLCFMCYKPDTYKYEPAYKKTWIFPQALNL